MATITTTITMMAAYKYIMGRPAEVVCVTVNSVGKLCEPK